MKEISFQVLGLLVGHTKQRPGAYSKIMQVSEYNYNRDLAKQIEVVCRNMPALKLKAAVETRDPLEGKYGDNLEGAFKKLVALNPICIIELHFNSFNGYATGSEVLFSDNYDKDGIRELALAQMLAKNMASILEIPSRGVKEICNEGERGFHNLAKTTDIPSVLIEPGFGDHPADGKALIEKMPQLANTIASTVAEWHRKTGV